LTYVSASRVDCTPLSSSVSLASVILTPSQIFDFLHHALSRPTLLLLTLSFGFALFFHLVSFMKLSLSLTHSNPFQLALLYSISFS